MFISSTSESSINVHDVFLTSGMIAIKLCNASSDSCYQNVNVVLKVIMADYWEMVRYGHNGIYCWESNGRNKWFCIADDVSDFFHCNINVFIPSFILKWSLISTTDRCNYQAGDFCFRLKSLRAIWLSVVHMMFIPWI